MNCPYCGQANPQQANFCRNCGRLLGSRCPRCQTPVAAADNFCHHCGLPLTPYGQGLAWTADPNSTQLPVPLAKPAEEPAPYPEPADSSTRPISAADPDAGRQLELDRFLPRELADKLEAARSSGTMVGERRVVTMLFCDVQGSTAAAEKLDPEDWTDIINGAFEYMIRPVYNYEGTVARLMGDAILAFFGAPIAHEDDPQRAVLTGLEIVAGFQEYQERILARYGFKIAVRVGINTGLVVVGAVGSDLRMEYTAMGDAINLAARMEQTAEPGTIQIAEPTYKLVSRLFDFEALQPVTVKGKEEPVSAYRVLGRKAVTQSLRGIEGMRSPLIGRDRELAALHNSLDRTQQGLGRIILLTGEAGLGKSRLIEEARQYWQTAGYAGTWQNVASFSYETNHAYGLMQRLIRRLNHIAVSDSPALVHQKLEPLIDIFPEERRPRIMQIFDSMFVLESAAGQPRIEGEAFRQELFMVMLQIWRDRFHDQPAVLIFDDLHWSDSASVQLLTHLLSAADSIPLVLIFSFRPDQEAPSAKLQAKARQEFAHRTTEIPLSPLLDTDINAILDQLLAIDDMPESLRQDILDRAGGNPFFVEEVVRSLVLSGAVINAEKEVDGQVRTAWHVVEGAQAAAIPDNLQSLLAARIDRLDSDIKATLQLASVIGRSFFERVLSQMESTVGGTSAHTAQHLRLLLQQQMIQEAARIPEVEYIFRSPLTQEVAYNGILLKRRREYHNRAGLAMEAVYAEQRTEMAPRLAYHFQEAQNYTKAFYYYLLAGDQARRFYAHQEALAHYNQALALVDEAQPDAEQLIRLYLERGRVLEHSAKFNEAAADYEALEALGEQQDNPEMRLEALIALGSLRSMQTPLHDPTAAQTLAAEALKLAQALGNKAGEAKIYWNLMQLERFRGAEGDIKLAILNGEKSVGLAREMGLKKQLALTLNDLSSMYRYATQYDEADVAAEEARELFRELGNLPMLADNYSQYSFFLALSGRYEEAEAGASQALKISQEIGNIWNFGVSSSNLSFIEMEHGHYGSAYNLATTAENLPGLNQIDFVISNVNLRVVEILAETGAWALAEAKAVEGLSYAKGVNFISLIANSLLSRVRLYNSPNQVAEEDLEKDIPISKDSMLAAFYQMYARRYQIELALYLQKPALAVQKLEEPLLVSERLAFKSIMPIYERLLAQALWQTGDQDGAWKALARGEAVAREIGSRRSLWPILVQSAEWAEDERAARRYRAEAEELIAYIADHAGDLRESYLNRPDIKRFFELAGEGERV